MSSLRVKFFRDGEKDFAEVRAIGDPNTIVLEVKNHPHLIEDHPREWAQYQAENPEDEVDGTPLTEIGMNENLARKYKMEGIRTVEELAEVGENAINGLGLGARQHWTAAKLFVEKQTGASEVEKLRKEIEALKKKPRKTAEKAA